MAIKRVQRTNEEKKLILKKIEELVKDGMLIKDAAKQMDIHNSQYQTWKRKFRGSKRSKKIERVDLTTMPVAASRNIKVLIVEGSPQDVGSAISGFFGDGK